MVRFMYNNATEIVMNNTNFYPNADGGNALGASTNGWNGLYLSDGTDKWSFVPGTNLLTLAAGADDQTVKLCGGSAAATTNGSCLHLVGDDVGGADAGGDLEFRPSDNAAATSKFYTPGGSLAWSVGASITQDATSGGNVVFRRAGTGIKYDPAGDSTPVAAGSTQADAQAMGTNRIQIVQSADGTKGVKFAAISTLTLNAFYEIYNSSASALKLYTNAAEERINGTAGTTAYSVAAWGHVSCYIYDESSIYCG